MPAPFIILSDWEVKEGKVEELKRFQKELSAFIEAKEPQLIAFNAFLNEEGTEMTSIQVHSDAASMEQLGLVKSAGGNVNWAAGEED